MSLRAIIGECKKKTLDASFLLVDTSKIILAGVRALDDAERDFISQSCIHVVGCDELGHGMVGIPEENVYIHIDLDVIGPTKFPDVCVLSDGGISIGGALPYGV